MSVDLGREDVNLAHCYQPRKGLRGRKALSGYTLTEMLVVVAIIGLIAAVVVPQTIGQLGKTQSRAAKLQMQSVAAAVELYAGDIGHPPTAEEGLKALINAPPGADNWTGPYLRKPEQINDPWSRPFIYSVDGSSFTLQTLGADGRPGGVGGDRDITVQ